MRLFSEEIRTGTLELLFTRPVPIERIVWAKYLAGLFLVLLSILPTWVYVVSLWLLAQPVGHIDLGGIVGSYIGLFFLSGVYVAVGTWASARTGNPIIAFIYAFVVSFLLYAGLDFIGEIPMLAEVQGKIQFWGIAYHYEPMSRGVIACSDVLYFVSFVFVCMADGMAFQGDAPEVVGCRAGLRGLECGGCPCGVLACGYHE